MKKMTRKLSTILIAAMLFSGWTIGIAQEADMPANDVVEAAAKESAEAKAEKAVEVPAEAKVEAEAEAPEAGE